ncbi:MAG TPA: hypothetical protein VI636_25515 [Candidatus Angelobacter sp.]
MGRVGQVEWLATLAGNGIEIVDFMTTNILAINNPLAIRRPDGTALAVVRLQKLDGPTPLASTFHRLKRPVKFVVNAICLPSGDHAGPLTRLE